MMGNKENDKNQSNSNSSSDVKRMNQKHQIPHIYNEYQRNVDCYYSDQGESYEHNRSPLKTVGKLSSGRREFDSLESEGDEEEMRGQRHIDHIFPESPPVKDSDFRNYPNL